MSAIQIPTAEAHKIFQRESAKIAKIGPRAAHRAAQKLRLYLRQRTDELKITDLGSYKAGFQVVGESVVNDAPHAGIVELGARPHPVSKEGVEAIARWVRRKLRITPTPPAGITPNVNNVSTRPRRPTVDEALQIAQAIAQKIRREGQAPRYVMRDSLPRAVAFYKQELEALLSGVA